MCEKESLHAQAVAECAVCGTARGTRELKPEELKVSAMPDIVHVVARSTDRLVLFCDGVVERLSNDDVGRMVHVPPHPGKTDTWRRDPAMVASHCLVRSLDEGSQDNHSAVLVYFQAGSEYKTKTEVIDVITNMP